MTQTTFEDPDESGGERLYPKDCLGHLLMVWATRYIDDSPTKYSRPDKLSDVIVVDVVNLDEADEDGYQGKVYRGCWWRQARLIGSLKNRIGKPPVIVRMAEGVPTMGKAPFELCSMSQDAECVSRGQAWLAAHPDFRPTPVYVPSAAGMEIHSTAVIQDPQPARQLSMLEQIAKQQAATLKPAKSMSSLPPAPPRPPVQDDGDIPF